MRSDLIGFGTLVQAGKDNPDTYRAATLSALEIGYRTLDTALRYENEVQVGQAIAQTDVSREDISVTTKIPGRFHGYHEAKTSIIRSLNDLNQPYVDAALIHWPLPRLHKYVDTWRAMIEMRDAGLIRTIGVSNFLPEHLERLAEIPVKCLPSTRWRCTLFQSGRIAWFSCRAQHPNSGLVASWPDLGYDQDPVINRIAETLGHRR